MSTMRQIAELAGVSASTVSRVINKTLPVKETARNKVLAAIAMLESEKNQPATITGNVGIVLPAASAVDLASHPSLYATVFSIIEALNSHSLGNTMILIDDRPSLEQIRSKELCGYLILGINDVQEATLLPLLTQSGLPYVSVNRFVTNPHVSSVSIDDAHATELAVNHLLSLGHRRIAFLGGNPDFSNTRIRCSSYISTLENAGIPYNSDLVFCGDYSEQSGKEMGAKLLELKELPTAACAASDSIAIGFLHELESRGLTVPEDMSLIGFGNIEASSYIKPALTTISQNSLEMGRLAAKTLLQLMETSCIYSQKVLVRTSLIIRDSCCPPKR